MLTLPKGSKVLFLAETTQREKDVIDDSKVYLSFFGIDPLKHVDFEFACYQSAYKWKGRHWDLAILDEIHEILTEKRFKFTTNNTYNKILGLSATIRSNRTYVIKGKEVSKMDMLEQIAPICFTYGIADAQREGTGRKLDIHVIYHRLEEKRKDIVGGNKQNPFMISEKKQYDYLDSQFWKGVYSQQTYLIKGSMSKRAKLLYSLPSKVEAVKRLLKVVQGKTIIFNNDLDALELITPNVVSAPRNGRTKKEQDEFNSILRDKFDKGHIRTIASFKVLKQGANLKRLDNEILMSFDSNGRS
jgi:superfamily II DNA or RNA helicase